MTTSVDERGRVLVPKDLRAQFGLEPGCPVIVEADADGIKLRRAIPRKEALGRLVGVIQKSAGRTSIDPLEAKRIWEPRP
ncbi:MAG: AbrB/MazE/SpoVT family DNA-binding domain-containing protein [Candidatus Thermoplasmatota archaeon]